MKNFLFIAMALCLFSCSTEENETFEGLNDPIIAEVHFQFSKYKFDVIGRLSRYEGESFNKIIEFAYDNDHKVIEVIVMDFSENIISTQNITYDSEGIISTINDRIFEFDTSENIYIETSTYYDSPGEDDGNGWISSEIYYNFYTINSGNYFTNSNNDDFNFGGWQYSYNSEENISTGELYEGEYLEELGGFNINNNNLTSDYGYDVVTSDRFNYDTNANPLFFENSNLRDIYSFLDLYMSSYQFVFSANNCIEWQFAPSTPEAIVTSYNYTFNSFNLPISVSNQNTSIIQYYYQGDVIPE